MGTLGDSAARCLWIGGIDWSGGGGSCRCRTTSGTLSLNWSRCLAPLVSGETLEFDTRADSDKRGAQHQLSAHEVACHLASVGRRALPHTAGSLTRSPVPGSALQLPSRVGSAYLGPRGAAVAIVGPHVRASAAQTWCCNLSQTLLITFPPAPVMAHATQGLCARVWVSRGRKDADFGNSPV